MSYNVERKQKIKRLRKYAFQIEAYTRALKIPGIPVGLKSLMFIQLRMSVMHYGVILAQPIRRKKFKPGGIVAHPKYKNEQ